jgi:hypothetical protein
MKSKQFFKERPFSREPTAEQCTLVSVVLELSKNLKLRARVWSTSQQLTGCFAG